MAKTYPRWYGPKPEEDDFVRRKIAEYLLMVGGLAILGRLAAGHREAA